VNGHGALSITERVWARDESLWGGPGVPEIGDRLGWLDIAERMREQLDELERWAAEVHAGGLTNTVLLGMGGSSLGPEVLSRSFGGSLTMLDSTDPAAVLAAVSEEDLSRTIFVVSSKSGGTIETLSHFKHFYALTGENAAQFCAVTDPGSPLETLAGELGFRRVWLADPNIGGRYSVLSFFGLVPAALAGVPLGPLLESAIAAAESCRKEDGNPGLLLGSKIGELAQAGRNKLGFIVDPPIDSFGLWVEQLIAESTGKHGRGVLPVADEPLGSADRYGDDRVFVRIAAAGNPDPAKTALADALEAAGQPVFRLAATAPAELGRLFFIFEFAVAVTGHVLGLNPFDQPDVQEAKDATARVLASGHAELPADDPAELVKLVESGAVPDYFALMAYLKPDPAFDAAIAELREAIRRRSGAATTFGYGPRYLHSTGQLHKGGPPQGRFVQFVRESGEDVAIPGESFGFRQLIEAQASGDFEALKAHGRPAVRLALSGDPASAVRQLAARLS
jgi:glucose-6-phosphate isomerase/transaldolase/glucose-6-phosphate isomerase